jgi:hypothetical protein
VKNRRKCGWTAPPPSTHIFSFNKEDEPPKWNGPYGRGSRSRMLRNSEKVGRRRGDRAAQGHGVRIHTQMSDVCNLTPPIGWDSLRASQGCIPWSVAALVT